MGRLSSAPPRVPPSVPPTPMSATASVVTSTRSPTSSDWLPAAPRRSKTARQHQATLRLPILGAIQYRDDDNEGRSCSASMCGITCGNVSRSRPRLVQRPRHTAAPGRTRLHIREDPALSVSADDGVFGHLIQGAPGRIRTCAHGSGGHAPTRHPCWPTPKPWKSVGRQSTGSPRDGLPRGRDDDGSRGLATRNQ